MSKPSQSEDNHFIPITSVSAGSGHEVTADVYYFTNQIVNVVYIGTPGSDQWCLIDAGMPGSGPEILRVAEERFGKGRPPAAIFLTHGHFDHVGGISFLLANWNCPVYAHPDEFPYLAGRADYPEPDETVSGGLLAKLSFIYPHKATDISNYLLPLPEAGSMPVLEGWRWIPAPGHSPGQVAFFRDRDRLLLSADAVITVRQDSLYRVLLQVKEVNGPPTYLTTDWHAARLSAQRLAALGPETMIPGHGQVMQGPELREGLEELAAHFEEVAVPTHGRYVSRT